MTRIETQRIRDFMVDLVRVMKKHDLWIDAEESSPVWVGNDKGDSDFEMFWDQPESGKSVEHLCAKLEPETVTTKSPEDETSPHSSVSLKGTRSDD